MSSSLPTVLALDKIWQHVASKPLWAPPNVWRYLKLRWRLRLRWIDYTSVQISAPVGKVNDCASCTDICCIGPHATVLLRLRDIAMLCDIGRTDLITHKKPTFSATMLQNRPALRKQLQSRVWQQFPVLKKSTINACAALSDAGKCTLYPHWPLSCARFPYALHLDDLDVFYSQRCQSFFIHPSYEKRAQTMIRASIDGYHERLKDIILLSYAPHALEALGLLQYLQLSK